MIAKTFYYMMVVGYFGCAMTVPSMKMKVVGILLTVVNGILFY